MPFLVKADFKTHLYAEVIAEITRGDDTIIDDGISAGISEAKGYLSRFDLLKLFGTSDVEPEVPEPLIAYLKTIVKDLSTWQMVKLSNPNIDLKLIRTSYEDAIAWLMKVQKGMVDPEGWPYKTDDTATEGNENNGIQWSSNKKRIQHF